MPQMRRMRRYILLAIFILSFTSDVVSQGTLPSMTLKRVKNQITLDGVLDEDCWYTGFPADGFWQYFPSDTLKAEQKTEIHMAYDDEFLYVGVKCFAKSREYITPSLRRDYRAGGSDNITLLFDTYDDRTNAFVFGINPYGVRREALISNGGTASEDFNETWDNKWFGEAKIYDTYWIAEFAIPFKTLRYKDGSKKWRFNSYRFDTQLNEISSWVRVPQNQIVMNLAYMGEMIWEEPLKKSGRNISVIPYVTGNFQQNYENQTNDRNAGFGMDAKLGVTSGLNLDLTVNPDFSQVEVDRQVTDLSRFEIFFPERRQFFLENADLFSEFGNHRIKPFFSRRIGLARNDEENSFVQNRIQYGARLSGKLDNNWRLGVMNMQTERNDTLGLPSFNYAVAAVQRKMFSRSNVGMIMVNRQTFEQEDTGTYDEYNRVLGVDYNLASSDNVWTGEFFYHQAITPSDTSVFKGAHGAQINYQTRKIRLELTEQIVGDGFDAQVGFVQRNGFGRISPEVELFFYPTNSSWINRHSLNFDYTILVQPNIQNNPYLRTDQSATVDWRINLKDNSRLNLSLENQYIYLTDDFDPIGLGVDTLFANTAYNFTSASLFYRSDRRKAIIFSVNPNVGEYYSGYKYSINGELTYAFRPFGAISLSYDLNYFDLPTRPENELLVLLGTRLDVTFTKKLFWTTFVQYNKQSNNFNINSRVQWRFKPASDLFLVYTDNYYASDFVKKDRAIVLKATYWLNL